MGIYEYSKRQVWLGRVPGGRTLSLSAVRWCIGLTPAQAVSVLRSSADPIVLVSCLFCGVEMSWHRGSLTSCWLRWEDSLTYLDGSLPHLLYALVQDSPTSEHSMQAGV
jgi:hypothetical protein